MNLTRLAIENNRLTIILVLIIIISGIQTFIAMPRAYDPGFIIRTAQVVTHFPGASPSRVEQLITAKIEEVVKEIPELDFVNSESRTGVSVVKVNIKESYKNMRPIWDNLRRKIEDSADDFPSGTIGPFVNDEFGDVYGIVITLTGEGYNFSELSVIAKDIRDQFQSLSDVAKVEIYGEQDERVFVEYDNARLSELGISPYQLSQSLETRNIVISGGSITLNSERIELEPTGNFESINDIEHTIIQVPGSDKVIYLKDIANITRSYISPPSSWVHSSGVRGLAIAIAMREGGNNIQLGEDVTRKLDQFKSVYPYGIEFETVNFSPEEVDKKVKDFVISLIQAILIVTVVMLLTLGMRTGLIVATLIPTTMLFSLLVMNSLNIGLDQISLAALIIALGMLVDNGIVMSENIMVQIQSGKSPINAAIDSSTELRIPLLTASLTTAAAFLPIYLAESNVGEFTASLFKVVTITLLCSWIISLTLIPMLCVFLLKVKPQNESFDSYFYRKYRSLLHSLLNRKMVTIGVTAIVFFVAMSGLQFIPKLFFPPSDRTYFKAELEMPAGTSIEKMESVIDSVEAFIKNSLMVNSSRDEGVTSWVSYVGHSGPRFILSYNPKAARSNYTVMIINATDNKIIPSLMNKLNEFTFNSFPDLDVRLKAIENGPAINNPVEVRISGANSDQLFSITHQLKSYMQELGGMQNISDDWGQRLKKLNVKINQDRALRAGVTNQDIAISLQTGLAGLTLTEYREAEEIIPVVLRSSVATQQEISKVESLVVYAQATGKSVPLRQVADIEVVWESATIYRRNGAKTVTAGAQLMGKATAVEKFAQIKAWLDEQKTTWPPGYDYAFGGEAESSAKANQSIIDKLPLAGFIILLLLVSQFNSLRKSFIVIVTIPLGFIGVVVGLLLGQSFFGFMTFLGVISLAGIVINNAIVLLERIKLEIDTGLAAYDAIVAAAQQRVRPILLTTATTVLGLLPLYLGGGEMWEPMALAIMGGLLFSTVLTLGVVPVLYALLFRVDNSNI